MNIHEFNEALFKHTGHHGKVLWNTAGPKTARIHYHGMILISGHMIYFQQFIDGAWEAFVPAYEGNSVTETFAGITRRLNPDN